MSTILETVDIATLEAGPELDALVAERVLSWKRERDKEASHAYWNVGNGRSWPVNDIEGECHEKGFHPSTDIAAAWQVVEHLEAQGYYIGLSVGTSVGRSNILIKHSRDFVSEEYWRSFSADAETMPLAICRAALATLKATADTAP